MRLFVAIFLPESIVSGLEALACQIDASPLRWIPAINLHITLRFLGDISNPTFLSGRDLQTRLTALKGAIQSVATLPKFSLSISGGGVFPDDRRPRIFWAGLRGEVNALLTLATSLNAAFSGLGIPNEDREFQPHLTLAKCRSDARCRNVDAERFKAAVSAISLPDFSVDAISLVRSDLNARGSHYEVLETFSLAA